MIPLQKLNGMFAGRIHISIILPCTDTEADGQNEDSHSFLHSGPALLVQKMVVVLDGVREYVLVQGVSKKNTD